tara:strand:+ start:1559 stop:2170 length:612 start_codon:yes stop_codon:yes gene_type:complete
MFITLEGTEGVGKSTLISSLKKYFTEKEIDFIFTKEPGGTREGNEIRNILLDRSMKLEPYAETLLLLADRAQHVKKIIKPALEKNKNIFSDRYIDSTYAYQGAGRGISQDDLDNFINVLNFPIPDLTIFLDLSITEGIKRVKKRGEVDRFEEEEVSFFEKIRQFYLETAKKNSKRFFVIDASQSMDEVFNIAKDKIINTLNEN